MILKDKVYDFLKYLIQLLPIISFVIVGLGEIYGFDTARAVGVLALIVSAIQRLISISYNNYKNIDGEKGEY